MSSAPPVIAERYQRSRIYFPIGGGPGGAPVLTPPDWDGSVAVHAPLGAAIEAELFQLKLSYMLHGRFFNPDGSDVLEGRPVRLRHLLRVGFRPGEPLPQPPFPPAGPIAGGAAGAWLFTNAGRTKLLDGTFDIDSDSFKEALFLSTSDLGGSSVNYPASNEHANGNGYTTGGIAITLTLSGTTTVTVDISVDPVWTAGAVAITAKFAEIHEVGGAILCYCLLDSGGADVTATPGNTLTVAASATGVFTLA